MSGIFNLITALEPGDGDEAVPEHLHLGADVEAEGGQLLGGEGVPVPEGAAKVILLVVIMAPGHDNILIAVNFFISPFCIKEGCRYKS